MTATQPVIAILNELLAAEQRSVALRFSESILFVSPLHARNDLLIQEIAKQNREHAGWLTETVLELGSAPGIPVGDINSGDLHFCDLRMVAERLVSDLRHLARLYEMAAQHVSADPVAAEVVARILARHINNLDAVAALDQPTA